jgi:hypothetical protein
MTRMERTPAGAFHAAGIIADAMSARLRYLAARYSVSQQWLRLPPGIVDGWSRYGAARGGAIKTSYDKHRANVRYARVLGGQRWLRSPGSS